MPTLCSKERCSNLTSSQDLKRSGQPYKLCGPCRARGRVRTNIWREVTRIKDDKSESWDEDIDAISNGDQDDLKRELDSELDGDDKSDLDLDLKPLSGIVASTGAGPSDRGMKTLDEASASGLTRTMGAQRARTLGVPVVRERARDIQHDVSDDNASDVDSDDADDDGEDEIAMLKNRYCFLKRVVETAFEMNRIEARLRVLGARGSVFRAPASHRQRLIPSGTLSEGKRLRQTGNLENGTNGKKRRKIM
ncbi:hypothetical protein BJ138DRAFT_1165359 [Hygrophoropsis aurantiaca]|uniref:Uncharacterized protein n=1 Tax=Hygrophoropsis aurantiaca TaxID=72124 RepID=A0ACB7ZWJ9_9AGAM|nr:hypothetical protein BJ138DRAFT_1165359 [Hygrophoropsis aurantiaca]